MTYHYVDSGLERIYLVSGYEVRSTPYGDAVSINDVEGLHRAIARAIVRSPKLIDGSEFRFIRKHLDLSQKSLGSLMGATEQEIYRWEKMRSKAVPRMADRLIRLVFEGKDDGPHQDDWILEYLADLNPTEAAPINLNQNDEGWGVAA